MNWFKLAFKEPQSLRSSPPEFVLFHLLVVLCRRAQDGQLGPAGFGFGRLAGVEGGLDERLQVLSFLENRRQGVSQSLKSSVSHVNLKDPPKNTCRNRDVQR